MEREEAINNLKRVLGFSPTYDEAFYTLFPEFKEESEDERIRKLLVWQVYRNIEDETNDLAGSVYDGIKGHDPDLEESIEDWKKCLAWLEKQKEPLTPEEKMNHPLYLEGFDVGKKVGETLKEQKPAEPSDEELQRHQNKLYDFKVFAARQAREHHISFVHDFEWNNFCAELLSYFNEKQKPAEWSKEDERMLTGIIERGSSQVPPYNTALREEQIEWLMNRLKSLRPQPIQLKEAYKDGFQTSRYAIASAFRNYLDENRPDGKMCLSNGECEDIDKAFKGGDWAKIMRYYEKYRPHWKPSEICCGEKGDPDPAGVWKPSEEQN